MTTVTLRKIPTEVYDRVKEAARRNRRSINSEIIVRLEESFLRGRPPVEELLARARALRGRARTPFSTQELLALRDEGRR